MPKKEDIEIEFKKSNHSKKDIEIEVKKERFSKKDIEIEFKKGEEDEDESLEEILEEIDEKKLSEFVPQFETASKTGTLGQIAIAPEIVTSGPARRASSAEAAREAEDPFKYDAFSSARNDEPKYIQAEHASARLERQNIIEVGRNQNVFMPHIPDQEAFSQRASELNQRGITSSSVEKYAAPERFDPDKAGRKSHFEQQKDTKYDPKLPRS